MKALVTVAAVVLALGAGAVSALPGVPKVRVISTSPFTVQGLDFRPGERVTVTVRTSGARTSVRTTTASPTGRFRTLFASVRLGACELYGVRAAGNKGGRAWFKPVFPVCGALLGPGGASPP